MTTNDQFQVWLDQAVRPILREVLRDELADLLPSFIDKSSSPTSPDEDQPLSVEQAAQFLNIKPQTVYQNISKIPHEKRHGRLYFTRRKLRAYLSQSAV